MPVKAQLYIYNCRFKTGARLSGYLGSTLRGALGWSLKKVSCALTRQSCESCLLRTQCAYAWIFETEKYRVGDGRTINARPHPLVLHAGETRASIQHQDDEFSFALYLFDRSNDYLPQIIYAIQLMGEAGIGAGRKQGLGRFHLTEVRAGDQCIFSDKPAWLEQIGQPQRTMKVGHCGMGRPNCQLSDKTPVLKRCRDINLIKLEKIPSEKICSIQVRLHTPLRLKYGNKLKRDLPFHILIRTALRRITAMEDAYGGGQPIFDYRGLIKRAEHVEITESRLRWQELLRYSNRQRKKISLSGLGGVITYKGDLTEFLPILHYCELVNMGKQTVFGLGRMSVLNNPG